MRVLLLLQCTNTQFCILYQHKSACNALNFYLIPHKHVFNQQQ